MKKNQEKIRIVMKRLQKIIIRNNLKTKASKTRYVALCSDAAPF